MLNRLRIFALLSLTIACREQSPSAYTNAAICGVQQPARQLRWLRERIDNEAIDVVTAATYQNVTYINLYRYIWSCSLCHLYRCDGTRVELGQLPAADQQELHRQLFLSDTNVIYRRQP